MAAGPRRSSSVGSTSDEESRQVILWSVYWTIRVNISLHSGLLSSGEEVNTDSSSWMMNTTGQWNWFGNIRTMHRKSNFLYTYLTASKAKPGFDKLFCFPGQSRWCMYCIIDVSILSTNVWPDLAEALVWAVFTYCHSKTSDKTRPIVSHQYSFPFSSDFLSLATHEGHIVSRYCTVGF